MDVVWSKKAFSELEAIYKYIKKESPQNADSVFNKIFDLAQSLNIFPYKFAIEPVLNLENVRFAVIWSFKIIYIVQDDTIVIARIFNTKQNPKKIKKIK